MPASVLSTGFSTNSSHFGGFPSSSSYSSSPLDPPYFQSSSGFNRPPSPNPQRKQQAPMPSTNSLSTREPPPPPPLRPSPIPIGFGANTPNLPAPIMPQPTSNHKPTPSSSSNNNNNIFSELNSKLARQVARAQSSTSASASQLSSNMLHGLDPFATPVSTSQYQNGTSTPPIPAPAMNLQGRASPQPGGLPPPISPIRPTPSIPPRPFERPPVPQRN
ncbi:unnamed protein product [Rotaria magnacalcarata]|nr:unnamed protein product [Rotaria magnacalcarata]CAF5046385.1 unnamed protein product [Rotaria magnacalcarata]